MWDHDCGCAYEAAGDDSGKVLLQVRRPIPSPEFDYPDASSCPVPAGKL
jgi:hypothetical protein